MFVFIDVRSDWGVSAPLSKTLKSMTTEILIFISILASLLIAIVHVWVSAQINKISNELKKEKRREQVLIDRANGIPYKYVGKCTEPGMFHGWKIYEFNGRKFLIEDERKID